MRRIAGATCACGTAGRWVWIGILVVLLCMFLPTTAFASAPDPDALGPDKCAQCHATEAATWGDSPHAHAQAAGVHVDVTCETCHGTYVPGHPQEGIMELPADGSCCQDCHTTTYQQWHATGHASAGVQCTSCHVPHSQETRLSSEALCESCHREEAEHWVHHEAGVHCNDCHISLPSVSGTTTDVQMVGDTTAPDHRFGLAVEACVDCHRQSIHDRVFHEAAGQIEQSQLSEMAERARELARELDDAKRTNRTLQTMSVVSLGFGLGTGGVLGMMFVLVVGFIVQGRSNR